MAEKYLIAAALFGSTALVSLPVLAQDGLAFTLDATGGVQGFNLPSYDPGVFGHVAGGMMFGGMIGVKGSTTVANTGGWDVVLGLNAFGSFGGNSSSWSDSTAPNTSVIVTGLSAPTFGAVPTFSVAPGAVTLDVTGPGAPGAHDHEFADGGASLNAGGVVPKTGGPGFVVASAAATSTTGGGLIGVGDPSGGGFEIRSTDGSSQIKTDVTRSLALIGADITLGLAGKFDGASSVQVYAGPSFRSLNQGTRTALTGDVAEAQPSLGVVLPNFTVALNDSLMSTYYGGIFGSSVSFDASPNVKVVLGMEAGAYDVISSWNEHDTYSTCCGLDPVKGASPNLSVDGPTHTADLGSRIALSAKVSAAAAWAVDTNKTISLGGNVGYLSAVPTVSHSGLVNVGSLGSPTTSFDWGSMVTVGATATLSGHF